MLIGNTVDVSWRVNAPLLDHILTSIPQVPLAKVDCTVEKETCQAQGIEGFPTLKVFRGKSASPFKGQRSAASIVEFMKKYVDRPAIFLNIAHPWFIFLTFFK